MKNKSLQYSMLITLLVVLVGLTNTANAQRKVSLIIKVADESGSEVSMEAGVNDLATDSLDQNLGEQFIPGHPPAPSAIHAAMLVENLLSYKNFRRIPDTNKFSLEYTINVNDYSERKVPFIFKWEYPLPRYIDSARIMDRLGGTIYSFPLDESRKSISITNEGLRNYNLIVWYSLPSVNVEEDMNAKTDGIQCFYDSEKILIHSPSPTCVSVYDALSNIVWKASGFSTSEVISTPSFSNGMYYCVCTFENGTIQSKKIILAR